MRVTVELRGDLRRYLPKGHEWLDVQLLEGSSVADLCRQLGIQQGEVWAASINGEFVDTSCSLTAGAKVLIFSPIAGG